MPRINKPLRPRPRTWQGVLEDKASRTPSPQLCTTTTTEQHEQQQQHNEWSANMWKYTKYRTANICGRQPWSSWCALDLLYDEALSATDRTPTCHLHCSIHKICTHAICTIIAQGSHSFTDQNIQDFPGPPWEIFQDLFGAHECLNIMKKPSLSSWPLTSLPFPSLRSRTL